MLLPPPSPSLVPTNAACIYVPACGMRDADCDPTSRRLAAFFRASSSSASSSSRTFSFSLFYIRVSDCCQH